MKKMKRFFALLLSVALVLSLGTTASAAENDGYTFPDLGEKTADMLINPGQYEITVGVPGAVSTSTYSEVIIMVDASSSQGANLEKLKAMLVDLAEQILHNDGSMRITLMGFGMGPKTVGSFYNAETLASYLAGVTQADLRQGVSATNCEAALDHVRKYIENSPSLNQTFVMFTSDGNTNMDETEFALSTWTAHPEWYMSGATKAMIASYAAGGQADLLLSGGPMLSATAKLYPSEAAAVELAGSSEERSAAVDALYAAITATEESGIAYVNAVWAEAFAHSGLTYADNVTYSTSRLEKVFLDFHGGVLTNSYLCTIHGMKNASFYPDWYNLSTWGARAADAADALASNPKVLELYMLDFSKGTNTWMNPASTTGNQVTAGNITYQQSSNYASAIDSIHSLAGEMFTTLYNNATVVDPMSKWVDLDPSSIRIYKDDLLIYEYGTGWIYENEQPAANPITLGTDENGNAVITWRIKDGPLLYTDRYFLKYIVDVDETVEGFEYGKEYPANDPTHVEYTDENGNKQTVPIEVPEVYEPTAPDDFEEGEMGIQIYKSSRIDKKPLSDITFDIYKVEPAKGDVVSLKPEAEEVAKYAVPENLIASITTNGRGYASYNMTQNGYGEGRYLIVERANAKIVTPVDPFYVVLPMYGEDGVPTDVVVIKPKNTPVEEEEPPIPPVIPDEPEEPENGQLSVIKHSSADESALLPGAQFQIYRVAAAGEEPTLTVTHEGTELGLVPVMIGGEPVTIETDENGYALSPALEFGLYFLVETQAPSGYNLLEDPIPVWVTSSSHLAEYAVKVPNNPGVELPETGGPGIYHIVGFGALLTMMALLLLMKKRNAA